MVKTIRELQAEAQALGERVKAFRSLGYHASADAVAERLYRVLAHIERAEDTQLRARLAADMRDALADAACRSRSQERRA